MTTSILRRAVSLAALLIPLISAGRAFAQAPGSGPVYDPKKDPLVNPASLTAPYPADKPGAVETDEVLVRLIDGNPESLNPIFGSSLYESHCSDLLFDTLFSFDEKMIWHVNREMVEDYQESADHLTATARLRPGLKWHDGRPFTARDVAFSFRVIMDDAVPAIAVRSGTDQLADVQAVDDLTVKYVHKKALATNQWNVLFPIIPEHIYNVAERRKEDPSLGKSDYYNNYNRGQVVGNGPYRLVKWVSNDQLIMERWEDFHGEKPRFKRQLLKIQPDNNTALLMFKKGDLDEIRLTAPQFAKETIGEEFARVGVKAHGPAWDYAQIGWNMNGTNPFFNDRNVRIAMAHAINIPRLISTVGYNLFEPCHGIFHPDSWMFNREVKLIGFDLKKAAKLLDEAGWAEDDNDGWRYKTIDGKRVKFEFELKIPEGSPYGPQVAAIFGQDLKKIGVSMLTRILEWATFLDQVQKHDFQAQISAWGTGTDPDTNWNLWHSTAYEAGRNNGKYSNPRVDELFVLARAEFDRDKRAAHYGEIQKLIYDDQPCIFLWNRGTTWGFNKRIQGVVFSPRGVFGFSPSYRAWWVSKGNSMRK